MSSNSTLCDSIYTHSTTATEWNQQEPFDTYRLKIPQLCLAIGLDEPIVEHINGGSFNRVTKLTFHTSGDQCVLRVPRNNDDPQKTARNVMDQVAIINYVGTLFPVPKILAYDSTDQNAIETPYIIQEFAPGQRLDEVLEDEVLTSEDCLQIASIIADIFARMQKELTPRSGRFVSSPNLPHRCDDVSLLSPLPILASFKIAGLEVPESTSSGSVKDLMKAIIGLRYEEEDDEALQMAWCTLDEIRKEMKSRGFLICDQPVLRHWDFAPQNILVRRKPDNITWEVTAVLDWDGVLSAPRVLTREPPVWLWQHCSESTQATTLESSVSVPRQLIPEEETIKQHFEDCLLQAGIDIDAYRTDAYGHGRWVRRLFRFLRLENAFLYDNDWEKYELFINEWESYCLEHPILSDNPDDLEPPAPLISQENKHWEDFDLFIKEWSAFCLEKEIMVE